MFTGRWIFDCKKQPHKNKNRILKTCQNLKYAIPILVVVCPLANVEPLNMKSIEAHFSLAVQ